MTLVTLKSSRLCITRVHSKLTLYLAFIIRFAEVTHSADHEYLLFPAAGRYSGLIKCGQCIPELSAQTLLYSGHEHCHLVPRFTLFANTTIYLMSG